jgi:hypothetical protein
VEGSATPRQVRRPEHRPGASESPSTFRGVRTKLSQIPCTRPHGGGTIRAIVGLLDASMNTLRVFQRILGRKDSQTILLGYSIGRYVTLRNEHMGRARDDAWNNIHLRRVHVKIAREKNWMLVHELRKLSAR